eukprot:8875469-Pyramimonas_sp.AAC.1
MLSGEDGAAGSGSAAGGGADGGTTAGGHRRARLALRRPGPSGLEGTNRRAGREEYSLSGPIAGQVGRNIP